MQGFLAQKTNFPVEIVIGEDCSTDRTREILLDYTQKHPNLFRLLLREPNMGAIQNFVDTIKSCRGKYIALCEGDDYWTDPNKLQKQVDFLEKHPECTSCFHDVRYRYNDGEQNSSPYKHKEIKDIYSIEDLLAKNVWTKTCSCVFKNGLINDEIDRLSNLSIGDWPLFVLLADKGKIGYIHEEMAVYRIHSNSTFSTIDFQTHYNAIIESRYFVDKLLNNKYHELIMPEIFRFKFDLSKKYFSTGDNENSKKSLLSCIKLIRYHNKIRLSEIVKLFLKVFFLPDKQIIKQ